MSALPTPPISFKAFTTEAIAADELPEAAWSREFTSSAIRDRRGRSSASESESLEFTKISTSAKLDVATLKPLILKQSLKSSARKCELVHTLPAFECFKRNNKSGGFSTAWH